MVWHILAGIGVLAVMAGGLAMAATAISATHTCGPVEVDRRRILGSFLLVVPGMALSLIAVALSGRL